MIVVPQYGATTFSITTRTIITLSVIELSATLSIMTLDIRIECNCAECLYAERHIFLLLYRMSLCSVSNIRLGWKGSTVTNTLAYYFEELLKAIKKFRDTNPKGVGKRKEH
jgi:hypothetical protein